MGKKDKKSGAKGGRKKSKSPRTSGRSECESVEKPEFYSGTNWFPLPNGDTYSGDYVAHKSGLIWREGHGIYETNDGQRYEGNWMNDQLIDGSDVKITYKNKSTYEGPLYKNKYTGPATFTFKNGIKIFSEFKENKISGDAIMADIDGRLWKGTRENDSVFFTPENIFYQNIERNRGKAKKALKLLEPKWKPKPPTVASTLREEKVDWEKIIFAKSTKTPANINWTDSPWYQDFLAYKNKRAVVLHKVETHQPLTKPEARWYMDYVRYKRNGKDTKKDLANLMQCADTSLLDKFYSKEYAESSIPYKVFYPSYSWKKVPSSSSIEEEEEAKEEHVREQRYSTETAQTDSIPVETVKEAKPVETTTIAVDTCSLYEYVDTVLQKVQPRPCNDRLHLITSEMENEAMKTAWS